MGVRSRANCIAHGGEKHLHRSNQNAQALVELALLLPILMILIVGALEFGRLWSTKIILTNAAREGAYFLSTHADYCTTSNGVITSAKTVSVSQNEATNGGLALSTADVSIAGTCTFGSAVTVTTTTKVDGLLILGLLGNADRSITLTSSVKMMVQ